MSKHRNNPPPKAPESKAADDAPAEPISDPENAPATADVAEVVEPAVSAPTPVTVPASGGFRVWDYGSLLCNGVTYAAGEMLPFNGEQIAALGIICAVPVG